MLTQIQRDAMQRAKAGDWALADAMELLCAERQSFRDYSLLGGCRGGGRMRFLAYGHVPECEECDGGGSVPCSMCGGEEVIDCTQCDGDKEVACQACDGKGCEHCEDRGQIECPKCAGTGELDCPDCFDGTEECDECDGLGSLPGHARPRFIVDLNGRVVADSERGDQPEADFHVDFNREQASAVLAIYHNPKKPEPAPATPGAMVDLLQGVQAA